MRIIFTLFGSLILWPVVIASAEASQYVKECRTAPQTDDEAVRKTLCLDGKIHEVYYNRKAERIEVKSVDGKISFRVPSAYDPTLVGSDNLIGFLPDKLQIYKKNKVLVYISSIRSSGGAGTGQCGSGSEIYLHFLDISQKAPKLKTSILIGSCRESIELEDQDVSKGKVGDITVVDNNLTLHFLNYKDIDGEPVAVVSHDYKLQFRGTPEN
jgi:hypothetical protein